ncbi:serine hydrolase domain-containing protein [Nonomuraea sp. NPDC004580]|uniref:serine hydrolase domain-containing protein n=1 Tax=Nonomuraea sp. NPDC004580 TaxID=3154552 RepID=UPI0033A9A847
MGIVICVITSILALTAGAALADRRSGTRTPYNTILDAVVGGGSTAAVAEVRNGDEIWAGSSGLAKANGDQPPPATANFRAGSITKSFTATVVLQLVGEGRLRLSDTIDHWLPGLLRDDSTITVRQLLQHTSGLPEYTTDMVDDAGIPKERYRTWSPRELVEKAERLPLEFRPGTRFQYSNTNYIVLGMLIEKVTGRPYATEIEQRILRPLDLARTWLPGASPEVQGPHAHGYVAVKKHGELTRVDVTRFNPTIAGAAGEIISTAGDLNRFYRALLGGKLLPPAQLKEMKHPGPSGDYGMGLEVTHLPCGTAYGHTGETPGYVTASLISADGTRQITLSTTPFSGDSGSAEKALLKSALCA